MAKEWRLNKSDLKRYPHFDPPIPAEKAQEYATDVDRVARHAFYPFIRFRQRWTRFARKGEKPDVKERPARYAARRDAYIFSRYRHILSERYESELVSLGLEQSILAYRRIRTVDGKGGKCNIHFASDAFLKIRELGDCCAIALDISNFFESLDHTQLKRSWARILGVDRLPADHFSVFKAITQYAIVDKEAVYERLGHFGEKSVEAGDPRKGYLTPFRRMPKHLCCGREFRELIAGRGGQKSIIEKHYKPFGIPQGAPISDLLANLYLIDFDAAVVALVRELGGVYFRYSDDILIAVPGDEAAGLDLMKQIQNLICQFGDQLKIKEKNRHSSFFGERTASKSIDCFTELRGKMGWSI
jgi:hypothetical protein